MRRFDISPSLLAADPACLGEEAKRLEQGGADRLHLDVMDGHFVPNLSFGPPVLKALKAHTSLPIDVHLMVSNPLAWVDPFQQAGAASLAFHLESGGPEPSEGRSRGHQILRAIHQGGLQAGLALHPDTPLWRLEPFLEAADFILVMTVIPGKGGQGLLPQALDRVAAVRALREQQGHSFNIQVDGGVTPQNAPRLWEAGADVLIAGTAILGAPDYRQAVQALRPH